MDINQILDYCKYIYRPGTQYISVKSTHTQIRTVKRSNFTIRDAFTIWAESGKGVLYYNGEYAKIVNGTSKNYELWI
jgi:hypothetical protein